MPAIAQVGWAVSTEGKQSAYFNVSWCPSSKVRRYRWLFEKIRAITVHCSGVKFIARLGGLFKTQTFPAIIFFRDSVSLCIPGCLSWIGRFLTLVFSHLFLPVRMTSCIVYQWFYNATYSVPVTMSLARAHHVTKHSALA